MMKDAKTPPTGPARTDASADVPMTAEIMEVGLKVARVGLGTVDYPKDAVRCDALAAEYFGLPVGKDVSRDALHARIHPDDWPEVSEGLNCLLASDTTQEVLDMTHRIVVEGAPPRWVNARKKITFDDDGRPVTGVFALVDITAQVVAEHRAQFLIGELNHRAKNLITVVSGLVRQLGRHAQPEDLVDKLLARLAALGRNQEAMLQDAGSRFGLRDVFVGQLQAFDDGARKRVKLSGPDLMISSHAAQILGMVVHELATNAGKYGALSEEGGRVEITWTVEGEVAPDFELRWVERGGPVVEAAGTPGFGTQVLTKLTEASLGAETQVEYPRDGLRFAMRAPLAKLMED